MNMKELSKLSEELLEELRGKQNKNKKEIGNITPELMNKLLAYQDAGEALTHEFELEKEELIRKYELREHLEVNPLFHEAWGAIHDHFNHTEEERSDKINYQVSRKKLKLYRIEE